MSLCPRISRPVTIVTSYNMGTMHLSSYGRNPGTTVTVSCVSPETHTLSGRRTLTCLRTGKWDSDIPKCTPKDIIVDEEVPKPSPSSLPIAGKPYSTSVRTLTKNLF